MKTLMFAHALLLSAAGADGSVGGESDPNLNDAGTAPQPEPSTGGDGSGASPDNQPTTLQGVEEGVDLVETQEQFEARIQAEREEFKRIRELTPIQELEVRACLGAAHLGVIIHNENGSRCVALADWRTDRLVLRAGDQVKIVVLAGDGQSEWDFYRKRELEGKAPPQLATVQTVSLPTAQAAAILGAQATAGTPAPVDPLENTQPVETTAQVEG